MKARISEEVPFDFIRYANCWEDAEVLLKGLSPIPGARILSVASGGDNSFSLLSTNPSLVVAADINKTQLFLTELKKVSIQYLSYDNLLEFLGFAESNKRIQMFNDIKGLMSSDAQKYWSSHLEEINKGIINRGKFERYFQLFSKWILPLIHYSSATEELLRIKPEEEQKEYYRNHWNSWRWKLLFKLFFSRAVMGKMGRDPQFFSEVKVPVSTYIFLKAEKHLQSKDAQDNQILRYNLTGNFGTLLPNYLLPENIHSIKSNIERLVIREGYVHEVAKNFKAFHCMNLSNIFEYLSNKEYTETVSMLLETSEKGCKMGYWNLMVPRRISGTFPQKVSYQKELSQLLSQSDKGFFYNQFIIDVVV
ncbi:S-adenosylmethionine:diacylglycerol 3-amino-3-carboxypropyl transferase [Sporocytophaga myxococcoides]|uniref:S-adenosylmethionine:diacylglycerol 3-amino-3-carboxypropyl transferase n=1 Tax=Sporocytophaga myxococcoides TaxID=153721 RepID=A0A098LLK5_9BACT|nr:DUF3419 family protein [Sporocytophaga myxococcoides]GAL87364.1 S-adenosylmethionine:diacylglycerol 3-amino-3-carboxypropyl transferase [Sporocytophaga myxococcoides]